jgi:sulfide:quinone oxidoreductase
MKRVLILGGGFGGLAAAHRLKEKLGEAVEVTLVDRRSHFMVGFRKSWALAGHSTLEAGQRPIENLSRLGVRVIRESVTAIHAEARSAQAGDRTFEADALIVALGAELAPEAVPGLKEHAFNVYDPQDVPRAAQALKDFKGGRIAIGIFGVPYKCSPAPYEMALLINEALKARRVKFELEVFSPQPMSMPVLGQAGCNLIEDRLEDRGITFLPNHKAESVAAGEVVFADERRPFDMLLAVPPHRAPAVVRESGLTGPSGWIGVEARTLATKTPGVYAIGDVVQIMMADGKPLPKAGVFAEAMGETVAERIVEEFSGRPPAATFKGEGGCYLEVGSGQAMMVTGSFLTEPGPEVTLTEASAEYFESKKAFETERLTKWFG